MTITRSSLSRLAVHSTLALAVLAALATTNAAAAPGGPVAVAAPTRLAHGDGVLGALPISTPIRVVIGLKLRDRAGLEAVVRQAHEAVQAGMAPHLLGREQVMAKHTPTPAQAQAVADYLVARGFRNVTISPSRMLVTADGTAANASDAFMTTFARVRTHDGRIAFANTDAVRIPAVLAGTVAGVLGLQTVHVPRSHAKRLNPGSAHTQVISGHNPTDFPSIYAVGSAAAATNIPVGIITEGNLAQVRTDLNTFTSRRGLPTVTTQTVNTGGTSSDTSGVGEWDLDSQNIVGMSGGVSKLVFYNMPHMYNSDLTANFDTVVTKNAVKIINVSLGECEQYAMPVAQGGDGSAAIADALFLTAAAQGQTFSISTGDSGADECGNGGVTPSWPANSPWVVAVAGTRLNVTSSGAWQKETVWSGSGGSPSTYEPMPAWQAAFSISGTTRAVADVAFDADPNTGSIIYVNGSTAQYGGTSLAAPLFAGLWARVLHAHPSTGFAAPVIYALPASTFHDVTSGNNNNGGTGFTAGPGYDFASGRGSMKINSAVTGAAGLATQLLGNTGFEAASISPWTSIPGSVVVNNPSSAHKGSKFAVLGSQTQSNQRIQQTVTIPAGKTLASLRFYMQTTTAEVGDTAKDSLKVLVLNSSGNVILRTLATYWNRDASTGYVYRALDMSGFAGQTVLIRFYASNDASALTTWHLDDVSLTVE